MTTGRAIAQALAVPESLKMLPGLTGFIARILHWFVFGHEVVLAYNHGARSVRLTRAWVGFPIMLILTAAAFFVDGKQGAEMAAVTLLVFVAFLHRHWEAWNTLKTGREQRHTMFMGQSTLLYLAPILPRALHGPLSDAWLVYRFVHPALTLGLGILVYQSGSVIVAIWLVVGGVGMAAKNQLLYSLLIDQLLDQYDAGLARHHMPRLLAQAASGPGAGPQHHAGMPVSFAMLDVLRHMPSPDMDSIVGEAMSNGAKPEFVQQEFPYD